MSKANGSKAATTKDDFERLANNLGKIVLTSWPLPDGRDEQVQETIIVDVGPGHGML